MPGPGRRASDASARDEECGPRRGRRVGVSSRTATTALSDCTGAPASRLSGPPCGFNSAITRSTASARNAPSKNATRPSSGGASASANNSSSREVGALMVVSPQPPALFRRLNSGPRGRDPKVEDAIAMQAALMVRVVPGASCSDGWVPTMAHEADSRPHSVPTNGPQTRLKRPTAMTNRFFIFGEVWGEAICRVDAASSPSA